MGISNLGARRISGSKYKYALKFSEQCSKKESLLDQFKLNKKNSSCKSSSNNHNKKKTKKKMIKSSRRLNRK